jgi:hypothetical protein
VAAWEDRQRHGDHRRHDDERISSDVRLGNRPLRARRGRAGEAYRRVSVAAARWRSHRPGDRCGVRRRASGNRVTPNARGVRLVVKGAVGTPGTHWAQGTHVMAG